MQEAANVIERSRPSDEINKAASSLLYLHMQREEYDEALALLPLVNKTAQGKLVSMSSLIHKEAMFYLLAGNEAKAKEAHRRGLVFMTKDSPPESASNLLRTRLALADESDPEAIRQLLHSADAILLKESRLLSVWHAKAQCHLWLKERPEALAALKKFDPKQMPPSPFAELISLLGAQIALLDESQSDASKSFRAALQRAEFACRAHRDAKNPVENSFAAGYWLDLRRALTRLQASASTALK